MTSWRDETSRQVQDELDDLLDVSLRAAQQQLDVAGEFYPFAVAVDAEGSSALLTPQVRTGPREVADVTEVFERCWEALREAPAARAGAVVTDVTSSDGDAIGVALEHRDGPAIEVFLPYVTQGKTNGKKPAQRHRFGEMQAGPGLRRIWPG